MKPAPRTEISGGVRPPARLHRRGTAMTEFVLIVPVLGVILGLTFFFGWALMHKHQVLIADRYAAWKRIETGSWPTEEELNEIAFANRATDVQIGGSQHELRETAEDLVGEVGSRHEMARALADELTVNRFPAGRRAHVAASFDANQALWEKFTGHIRHRHAREGVTWRRDEVNCWSVLRDQYYDDFDQDMQRIRAPGNGMAQMIRRLYLRHW